MGNKHRYFTYIMASKPYVTLYIGVTGDLAGRAGQHRDGIAEGFTKRYGVDILVWYEEFADIHDAILREKRIKKWQRAWKVELIETANAEWKDLLAQIV